jgi:hypothetical protein
MHSIPGRIGNEMQMKPGQRHSALPHTGPRSCTQLRYKTLLLVAADHVNLVWVNNPGNAAESCGSICP